MLENAVITGIGAVSRSGLGIDAVAAILEGRAAAAPDSGALESAFRHFLDRKQAKYVVKITGYGIAAGGYAIDDAGLRGIGWPAGDVGVFSASSVRPPKLETDHRRRLQRLSESREPLARRPWQVYNLLYDPIDLLRGMVSAPGDHTTVANGFRGATCTFLGGPPSALFAMTEAARRVRRGEQRAMVVIASDGLANPWWRWLRAREAGRPCPPGASEQADAAVGLVLEAESSARSRGVPIYARLGPAAFRSGRHGDPSDPLVRALRAALRHAQRDPAEVHALLCSGAADGDDEEMDRVREQAFGDPRCPRAAHARRACGDVGVAAGLLDIALAARSLAARDPGSSRSAHRILVAARGATDDAAAALVEAA